MAEFTKEAVKELSAYLNEPEWMLDLRLNAFEVYEQTPMPTLKDEEWRRTNIRRLKLDTIGPSLNGAAGQVDYPARLSNQLADVPAGGELIQVDGVTKSFKLSDELKEQGIIFCDMSTAVNEHPDLVKEYFMTKAVPVTDGKFAAMHGAFWRGGTFIYVPKNVKAAAPLHTSLWNAEGKTFTHTLVILDEGAEAVFTDEYGSPKDAKGQFLHNGVVELIVKDNASLTYVTIQEFGDNMWQFSHERGRVGRDG
ncbi:MAG: SufD family Fe-S cluster assembly protein, partial [Anaerolineales bacterium]|nr:SufD family Fe-S cluster assembly protein [Anaerolineales bacterium]